MQKVIHRDEIKEYSDYIDQSIIDYIADGQIETYESFEKFDLIAFDWYNLKDPQSTPAQIIVYIDEDDLFYICENEKSFKIAREFFASGTTNEQALYLFFKNLFKGSSDHLEALEKKLATLDDVIAEGTNDTIKDDLIDLRNEIFRMKNYYEQLEFLFEEICDNDNKLISKECLKYFKILHNRSIRLVSRYMNLREYVVQVREAYQSQIGIEQNDLMKVFTLVTSIFMPLSLIAGWYGMNVIMPEFAWKYGYLFVVGLCVFVCIIWFVVFKKKNLFK